MNAIKRYNINTESHCLSKDLSRNRVRFYMYYVSSHESSLIATIDGIEYSESSGLLIKPANSGMIYSGSNLHHRFGLWYQHGFVQVPGRHQVAIDMKGRIYIDNRSSKASCHDSELIVLIPEGSIDDSSRILRR